MKNSLVVSDSRVSYFLYFFYLVVVFILLRFFYLQIIQQDFYLRKSLGNTERRYIITPSRGLIYDRNGVLIAKNKDSFSLSLIGAYTPKSKKLRYKLFKQIHKHFGLPFKSLERKYQLNKHSYTQVMLKEILTPKEMIYFSETESQYPFLSLQEYSGRIYPFKESLSHVLGYLGAINNKEYEEKKKNGYRSNQIIGKAGLEEFYENILSGQEGQFFLTVDTWGRKLNQNKKSEIKPVSGKNLSVSIDSQLQEIAYHGLKNSLGVVIVTKVSTGEVLALVSSPGYDPNEFIQDRDKKDYVRLLNDPQKPLLNRPIQGRYAPGSIFKIVVALAGLEDQVLDPNKVEDTSKGYFKLGNQIFKDHGVKRSANLSDALTLSNNVYFYRLGYLLGYASILEYSINLGLKQKTGIDLPYEKPSFIPTPEWKEKQFHSIWQEGDTVNVSIGQGFLLFTPLGVHNIISTIAAGKVISPRIVWEIHNPYSGEVERKYKTKLSTNFHPSLKSLEAIRKGLFRVPYEGTARWHQYLSKVKIAGKTGTAQNENDKDHAWFTSYGPVDKDVDEQYAITVIVEKGGFGSGVTPITSILYNYLEGLQTKQEAIDTLDRIIPRLRNLKGQ